MKRLDNFKKATLLRSKIIVTFVALMTIFASCDKEDVGVQQGGTGIGGGNDEMKKLVKITNYEYFEYYKNESSWNTYGHIVGEEFIWTGNNITGLSLFGNEGDGMQVLQHDLNTVYEGDNLIEMTTLEGSLLHFNYSNNLPVSMYEDGKLRDSMIYSDEGLLVRKINYSSHGEVNSSWVYTWENGNIVSKQDIGADGNPYFTTSYAYDSKKNPFSNYFKYYILNSDETFLSANNVVKKTVINHSYGSTEIKTYTYVYEGDYPVKKCEIRVNDYSNAKYVNYYEYSDGTGKQTLPQFYSIQTSVSPADGYCVVKGGGMYASGDTVAVVFFDNDMCYSKDLFLRWSDGNTQNPRVFKTNRNESFTAIWEEN